MDLGTSPVNPMLAVYTDPSPWHSAFITDWAQRQLNLPGPSRRAILFTRDFWGMEGFSAYCSLRFLRLVW